MNIEINICTANSCKIIIKESKGDYISEDSTNVVKNRFKFSDTVSIDLLQHIKVMDINYKILLSELELTIIVLQ